VVWIRQRRWRVERTHVDGNVVQLDVENRDGRLTFLAPFDRPETAMRPQRPVRVRPQQAMARLASLVSRTSAARVPSAALEARVRILPHQLEPLLAVLGGHRRILIADEVGLGKTIQAGLILAELQRRDSALRAIVIVPAALRDQWTDELTVRFALRIQLADRAGVEHAGRLSMFGESPWQQPGIWLASPDYLKQQHVLRGLPAALWDLVVIDEAHDACGESERHAACDAIARSARRLVLLTATPHSGDEGRYTRLLDMGDLPGSWPKTLIFRRTRADVSLPARRRMRWRSIPLRDAERRLLDTLRQYERAVLHAGDNRSDSGRLLLLSVFRKRALSTVRAFVESVNRRVGWLNGTAGPDGGWRQERLAFEPPDDELAEEERRALAIDSGLAVSDELALLRRLQLLAANAATCESKLAHLASLVSRTPEPVVIFTEFRDSLEAVATVLRPVRHVAMLHGSQSALERRRDLQRFLSRDASVLIATDVAGQGLNLQTRARWVISLELPWNPVRLEQRVGRVDRIGQTRDVHASVLVARHDAERTLLLSLARRTVVARQSLGASVLRDISPPAPMVIAAAVLTGSVLPDGAPNLSVVASDSICGEFRRAAIAVARVLEHKRSLGARWRGPDAIAHPIWTSTRTLRRFHAAGADYVALLSVPFVDGNASLVERHLVAVHLLPCVNRKGAHLVAFLLSALAGRLEARRRRLEKSAARLARGAVELEATLARQLRAAYDPGAVQPGLFSQQAGRSFANRDELRRLDRDASVRMRALARTVRIEIGRPSLEMLMTE
jgi:superfamily II DNA or RNA helicase